MSFTARYNLNKSSLVKSVSCRFNCWLFYSRVDNDTMIIFNCFAVSLILQFSASIFKQIFLLSVCQQNIVSRLISHGKYEKVRSDSLHRSGRNEERCFHFFLILRNLKRKTFIEIAYSVWKKKLSKNNNSSLIISMEISMKKETWKVKRL